jgi:hypothetical protein
MLTDTILEHIPHPAAGWTVYRQTAPKPTEEPPWVIETVTTDRHQYAETMRMNSSIGKLDIRIVSTTADAVNVLADNLMLPALTGKRFIANGFDTGCLTLDTDSGTYHAGLTAEDTALLYQCRLLRFRFGWSRLQ